MLPRIAVDNITAVFEAVDRAGQGDIAEGYRVLLHSRQVALEGEQNFRAVGGGARRAVGRGPGAVCGALWSWAGVTESHQVLCRLCDTAAPFGRT